jgi:hypothetical protein
MSDTQTKNTLSHAYVKKVLVTHLDAVLQHVTTRGASETGKNSHKLACLRSQNQGGKYYYYGVPNVTP